MPNLNVVHLIGTLTRDPETRYTPGGTAITSFSLAINERYTTAGGEKRDEVVFIECDAWGKLGSDVIGKYCFRGHHIYVQGKLRQDTWDDKTTGQKRSKIKVVVSEFEFIKKPNDGGGQSQSPTPRDKSDLLQPYRKPVDPDLDGAPEEDDIPFVTGLRPGFTDTILAYARYILRRPAHPAKA